MRESRKVSLIEGEIEDYSVLYRRKVPFTLKFFVKDIDITKRDFLLLFLMFSSLLFLLFAQFALEQVIIGIEGTQMFFYTFILIGLFTGLILSIFLNDRITNPLEFIYRVLILSISIFAVQVVLMIFKLYLILHFVFFLNTAITLLGTLLYFKLFLIKTTILERGRVWAYFFVLLFIEIVIFISLIFLPILAVIPLIMIILTIVFLHRHKEESAIILKKSETTLKGFHFKIELLKYLLFYICFGLTAGFATSGEKFAQFTSQMYEGDFLLLLTILFTGIIASILLGIIFDFTGRTGTLSFILFTIAFAIYLDIYQLPIKYFSGVLIFIVYIAGFMSVLLLVGDTATRETIGRNLAIFFIFLGAGLLIGSLIRTYIELYITDTAFSNSLIMATTFMACILCYIFLVNMKETLPRKEQAWKNFLKHLYLIHDSGILLYQQSYEKETQVSHPDLISGGIIGIQAVIKEIARGEEQIRTIDHGDRILIFKSSNVTNVIVTLVVKEELIVLRKKIDSLLEEFDEKFFAKTSEISITGIDMKDFAEIESIVEKYFG